MPFTRFDSAVMIVLWLALYACVGAMAPCICCDAPVDDKSLDCPNN